MSLTTDPNDPRLKRGADTEPVPQNEVYLVLSEEERAKGFVRPVRATYRHVGIKPQHPLRDLEGEGEEAELARQYGYVKFERYPDAETGLTGRFWTQEQLDARGCGRVTTMGRELAETYARDPHFYGSTYCVHCHKHLPVAEFVWEGSEERVGS